MTRQMSNLAREHAQQLESEYPFIWLFELQTRDDPPRRYRYTNYTESVPFGEDSDGDPIIYSPAPVAHGGISAGSDGDLPSIDVAIANVSLELGPTVDQGDGFIGNPMRITVVSILELDNPNAGFVEEGEVVGASVTPKVATFRMSAYNLYQAQFPPFLYDKRKCRWLMGSSECGYNVSAPGAGYTTCLYTLEACEERGADEEANPNVAESKHPERIGSFPGIPRLRRGA